MKKRNLKKENKNVFEKIDNNKRMEIITEIKRIFFYTFPLKLSLSLISCNNTVFLLVNCIHRLRYNTPSPFSFS